MEDNLKDLEIFSNYDRLQGANIKSTNFLPEIQAQGIDKRQLPRRGGGDSLSKVLLQHSNIATVAQKAANRRLANSPSTKYPSASTSVLGSHRRGNSMRVQEGSKSKANMMRGMSQLASSWEKNTPT
jgi:hypothetical protein